MAEPQATAQTQVGTQASPLVCVIEDDYATREVLCLLLKDAGYRVIAAADGGAGCAILRESDERLIALVDYKMPVMGGCDLLERAASDAALRARHAFIFVTASPKRAEEDCGATLDELDVPLVSKPFDIDELLDSVAEAVKRLS